ncbi:MAG: UDP-glucose 4-epimerase GalE [Micrococcales bacterium]
MSVLVTGGAGYIGSHVTRLLQQKGEDVVVADNLSAGIVERIGGATLIQLDLAAPNAQEQISAAIKEHEISSVVHLAARKQVGQSVEQPEWYYQQNVGGLTNLLLAMKENQVTRLVFSSSAATYGMPDVPAVFEDIVCQPINPYGETKLIGEWMVANAAKAWGLRAANLRYFNVAGTGWPELADTAVANLVPIVFAAIKAGKAPKVFGSDYPTADGSCVRDYVHVLDLAEAHLSALSYLEREDRPFDTFNVGTGTGSSVFEVLAEIKRVSGIDFDIDVEGRRAGDPPALCADVSRIRETLGWSAKRNLSDIVESAWAAAL